MKHKIKFGYEIDSGKEVQVPMSHTVITGITNESGKTTAVMGLIKRSDFKAIIIKTKIGEKAITEGAIIPPFYRESFDWEYASELLEASRKEKLKFERSWIIKYSKTATNLLEFKRNIDVALAEGKLRELDKSVLISLQAYLEKILPELQYAPLSKTLDIRDGINIMDLERFKEETQAIVIHSVLDEVLKNNKNTIICIPECWRWLPERISTPVKRPAEAFIRQGATNNNFLILDSQDVTGISKSILKQVSIWCLGRQQEINEIERTLDQIPLNKKSKPKPEDIATLKLGQFYVATSDFTKKCYAQPSWVDDKTAVKIAKGEFDITRLEQPMHIAPYQVITPEQKPVENGIEYPADQVMKKLNELRTDFISNRNDFFTKFQQINETISKIYEEIYKIRNENKKIDEDEIVMRVLQKIPAGSNAAPQMTFNKEELISEVMARVPRQAGSVVYEVAPLEKIKKDFLEECKNKVLTDIEQLRSDEKKVLKYLESVDRDVSPSEIITKCLLLKVGGSQSVKVSNILKSLKAVEVVERTAGGRNRGVLKQRIRTLLENHNAAEQEIEQVYNHVLAKVIGDMT